MAAKYFTGKIEALFLTCLYNQSNSCFGDRLSHRCQITLIYFADVVAINLYRLTAIALLDGKEKA